MCQFNHVLFTKVIRFEISKLFIYSSRRFRFLMNFDFSLNNTSNKIPVPDSSSHRHSFDSLPLRTILYSDAPLLGPNLSFISSIHARLSITINVTYGFFLEFAWWHPFFTEIRLIGRCKDHAWQVLLLLMLQIVPIEEKLLPWLHHWEGCLLLHKVNICSVVDVCISYFIVMLNSFMLLLSLLLLLTHRRLRFLWYMSRVYVPPVGLLQMLALLCIIQLAEQTLHKPRLTCCLTFEAVTERGLLWVRLGVAIMRGDEADIGHENSIVNYWLFDTGSRLGLIHLLFVSLFDDSQPWKFCGLHNSLKFFLIR